LLNFFLLPFPSAKELVFFLLFPCASDWLVGLCFFQTTGKDKLIPVYTTSYSYLFFTRQKDSSCFPFEKKKKKKVNGDIRGWTGKYYIKSGRERKAAYRNPASLRPQYGLAKE